MDEKILTQTIREIYADAAAEVGRAREKIRQAAKAGDTEFVAFYHSRLVERERAMNRIGAICRKRGFDPTEE